MAPGAVLQQMYKEERSRGKQELLLGSSVGACASFL